MGDFWQATAEMYSGVLAKPRMTEKLLLKPPFRFLHDVIVGLYKATGYPSGIFSEDEMVSANVASKDAKIAFLTKAIESVG
jgi:TRAF3-interacting protein 1